MQVLVHEACIAYTGGTTGVPKGVIHTQKTFFFGVVAQCVALNLQREDLFLLMTPLTHAAGIVMYSGMMVGCKFIIEKQFDPFKILEIIEREKVKKVFLVPVLIYLMLEMLKQKKYDLSSLDSIFYAASPISPTRLVEAMETIGPIFIQSYGQSESLTVITALLVEDHLKGLKNPKLLQSCGRPGAMVNLKILDDNDNEIQVGQVGEICLQNPYVMRGYLNQPEL
ncbi:MAG: AMP-binding protein, partial [Nitrospirae bacterium]|nr:AMP-binding protein [Nitrospirota bacterium]